MHRDREILVRALCAAGAMDSVRPRKDRHVNFTASRFAVALGIEPVSHAKDLIEVMRGRGWVRRNPRGSTFRFTEKGQRAAQVACLVREGIRRPRAYR